MLPVPGPAGWRRGQHFRGWSPTPGKPPRGKETYPDLRIFSCKDFVFSLLAATATTTHSVARVRAAARGSKTTAKAGARVLLQSSVARVPLGATAAAAAAAECSCARDCLATPCWCLFRARCG